MPPPPPPPSPTSFPQKTILTGVFALCFDPGRECGKQDIATPLLYRTIVLSDGNDPFLHSNRRSLLRTLYTHPRLRAHVREVHQSSSEEGYFKEEGLRTVWEVLPLLPSVERVGGFELKREYEGQEEGVFKKGLKTLSVKLYKRDPDQQLSLYSSASTVGRSASPSAEGEVIYPSLTRWFDLSTLVRLDIQASTVPQRLLPFLPSSSSSSDLPQFVDLRLKGFSWRTDLEHVRAFLGVFGRQLRRLDLSTAKGEEGVRFGLGRLDLGGLCGGLEVLGLDGGSGAVLDFSEGQTTTTRMRSRVKTLLIGLSAGARSAIHHSTTTAGSASTLRLTDLVARPWFEPLLRALEPERVRLTDVDGQLEEDVARWVGRRVYRMAKGASVEDREGRFIV